MADEDGFLQRWSRRKTAEKSREEPIADPIADPIQEAAAVPAVASAAEDAAAPGDAAPPEGENEDETIAPEDLPDIESLEASSDFSVFMQAGVPEELKKMALRRLWMLDPAFNEVDGLVEYGEDFTKISLAAVKSIYQVGKGFVTAEDEAEIEDKIEAEIEDEEGEGEDDAAEIPVASAQPPEPDDPPQPDDPPEPEKA